MPRERGLPSGGEHDQFSKKGAGLRDSRFSVALIGWLISSCALRSIEIDFTRGGP